MEKAKEVFEEIKFFEKKMRWQAKKWLLCDFFLLSLQVVYFI